MSKLTGWITVVLGLAALALALLWLAQPAADEEEEGAGFQFMLPVTLVSLEQRDLEPVTELNGSVVSARRARLGFDAAGLVTAIEVQEAQRVEADTLLARLDDRDQRLELESARAAELLASRELELLLAGERSEEKRRLEAELEAAVAQAELARIEVDRGQKLLTDRVISESEQDRRRTEFRAADQRRVAAAELVARARAGARKEDVAIAEARVAEARARVDTAEHEVAKTELRAPWDGAIVRRMLSVGDFVSEGDEVFELVDLENLEVHVEIPARHAERVRAGAPVRIASPSGDFEAIDARLDATIPAADGMARSFRGIVRLATGAAPDLRPGMFVRAELFLEPLQGALCLDADAILVRERGSFVVRAVRAEGGEGERESWSAAFVPVRILAQVDGVAAVASLGDPLAAGDQLILKGVQNAFPGAPLLVRADLMPDGEAAGTGAGEAR